MSWSPSGSSGLRAVLIAGVLIALLVELLGGLGLIAPGPVTACWLATIGGALGWHRHRTGRFLPAAAGSVSIQEIHPLWAVTGLFLAVTFLTGLASAPNSWDAITYHLPRIERWVEQGHLGFWPTSVDRQLWMSPWPGYLGLQFRLLTGGDSLAFLPAWLGYLGSILLTAGLVRQLGGSAAAQAWGAFTMAMVPVAVHQATAVQTDLIAGFWILAVVALVVEAWRDPERGRDWRFALTLAAAVALAFASKGTAALALAPWLVLLAATLFRRGRLGAMARPLVAGVVVMGALNLPHLVRTKAAFGSPFGASWTLDMLQLSPLTPGRVTGNIVANLSLHAGLPWAGWNAGLGRAVLRVNEAVGVDPAVQYRFYDGFRINPFSTHESEAGMPAHLLLMASGLLGLAVRSGRALPKGVAVAVWTGTLGFLLLLAVLRWQPFGARLQLAGLMWLPAVAPFLVRAARARLVVTALLLLNALPALLIAMPRPLLGPRSVLTTTRSEQFAIERPEHYGAVERAMLEAGVRGCSHVGLLTGWDQPEYYLWTIARREGMSIRWEHLLSLAPPRLVGPTGISPEVCQLLLAEMLPGQEMFWLDGDFRVAWAEPPFEVHIRVQPSSEANPQAGPQSPR